MLRTVPLIYDQSSPGRTAYSLPALDVPAVEAKKVLPGAVLRQLPPELPEVSEVDVVRHFTRLSQLNHGVDVDFYPLGSCTMKYNPKINEEVVRYAGFAHVHPYVPDELAQGALQLMYELQTYLAEIAGMKEVTLQPAAGAHGELAGLLIIAAYHRQRGEHRTKIIIPDSAHGTNPASAVFCGFETVEVKSDARGGVDIEALKAVLGPDVAGLMLTNPNTLGLFDENIKTIAKLVHDVGGLLYYDGANANAIMGRARPGDMGFDVIHFNLHKTFATPHGGGGPGSGPVGVRERLVPFLPVPRVVKAGDKYRLSYDAPQSIGRVKGFYGNFGVVVKAYTYIRMMGPDGLKRVSEDAVLNANYLMEQLKGQYWLQYDRTCKHEFCLSGKWQRDKYGVRTLDIAKRLLDYGVHPPTVYFPLIVEECLMIEPTETESKETLDRFVQAMLEIAKEAETDPESVKSAPHHTVVGRLDESRAARQPVLRWRKG
ncbi:MAG: aminomethyl-transferring glycine dehydrogenase subunit GcvPB [Bacillota bacterium]